MTDIETQDTPEPKPEEPRIMCYVSKKMVPKSETVEVEYAAGKKVWVQARYIRYDVSDDVN